MYRSKTEVLIHVGNWDYITKIPTQSARGSGKLRKKCREESIDRSAKTGFPEITRKDHKTPIM